MATKPKKEVYVLIMAVKPKAGKMMKEMKESKMHEKGEKMKKKGKC